MLFYVNDGELVCEECGRDHITDVTDEDFLVPGPSDYVSYCGFCWCLDDEPELTDHGFYYEIKNLIKGVKDADSLYTRMPDLMTANHWRYSPLWLHYYSELAGLLIDSPHTYALPDSTKGVLEDLGYYLDPEAYPVPDPCTTRRITALATALEILVAERTKEFRDECAESYYGGL